MKKKLSWTKRKVKLPWNYYMLPLFSYFLFWNLFRIPDDEQYPKVDYYFLGFGCLIILYSVFFLLIARKSGNRRAIYINIILQFFAILMIISSLSLIAIPFWVNLLIFVIFITLIIIESSVAKRPRNIISRYLPVLLERAARSVNSAMDGFTDRPYPAGKFDYDEIAVRDFATFIRLHLIATPFYEDGRTILVLSNGLFQYFKSAKPSFSNLTYVSFCNDGSYDVHISRKDYKRYKKQLTFDELCRSLGEVVVDLYNEFRAGRQQIILKDLHQDYNGLLYDV